MGSITVSAYNHLRSCLKIFHVLLRDRRGYMKKECLEQLLKMCKGVQSHLEYEIKNYEYYQKKKENKIS